MGKTNQTPSASSKASTSKRSRNEESPGATSPTGNDSTDILTSIDKKLSSFDARMSLLEILHREFQALRESLEFSQQQVQTLAAENATLRVCEIPHQENELNFRKPGVFWNPRAGRGGS